MYHLKNKTIILGVSGGIACYKSVELVRLLQKAGASVYVVMTQNATRFVGPLTFEAISGHPVCLELFAPTPDTTFHHIQWAEMADAVLVAPTTANVLAKVAHGIADDALTTFLLAVQSPILLSPSMNTRMWENKAVQENVSILENRNISILQPASGELACGTTGAGRQPDAAIIVEYLHRLLSPQDYYGKKILVTAGPTIEYIDPVRFISNPSSGKMGYAIARAFYSRGANVTLITGPTHIEFPFDIRTISVQTANEMADAVFEHESQMDIIIKAAAVADYHVTQKAAHKIKKDTDELHIALKKNQDILKELGRRKKHQILVGFAAETQELKNNALQKLSAKNLDMIVANIVGQKDSGFQADTNHVMFFFKDGKEESIPLMSKESIAHLLLDRIQSNFLRAV
ncbi:MAG: bifunctional phosphopantothenoylcysteine decarboxylase/phosphopantothenate--cysteine ligase CoaBC [Candidatus Magnetomorum sp.]|nr:bifunctional phosphopantothenoylcysteine decarboxylase/phosphopantothenate--cysteine ligase CoaBC [Candidatus Magnetomorum sp.]